MSVSCTNKFKRHRGRTAKGIKIAAGSAETTFTTERNNFNITAKFATVKSVPIVIITAMKHFVNILKDGITNNDTAICNSIKMIVKNSLHNIHKYILQQNLHKNQPHPSRMRGRGAEVCLSALFYRLLVFFCSHIECVTACRFILNGVKGFSGLSIASKMILSVIIWGFVDFGNELQNITYLPTNFEMELTILSEKY